MSVVVCLEGSSRGPALVVGLPSLSKVVRHDSLDSLTGREWKVYKLTMDGKVVGRVQ